MFDEISTRRPGFIEGRRVRLADGRAWSLPLRDPVGEDPEYDAILAAVNEAEDRSECLLAEFALTIFLLTRNYDLRPDPLETLLSFPQGDPALAALQEAVHALYLESVRRSRAAAGATEASVVKRSHPFRPAAPSHRFGTP
jgi:hypothetical protein